MTTINRGTNFWRLLTTYGGLSTNRVTKWSDEAEDFVTVSERADLCKVTWAAIRGVLAMIMLSLLGAIILTPIAIAIAKIVARIITGIPFEMDITGLDAVVMTGFVVYTILGGAVLVCYFKERLEERVREENRKRFLNPDYVPPKESLVKVWWHAFKEKTCVLVEVKDGN